MEQNTSHSTNKPLGFWTVWALIAGIMIGSGIFALPASMAALGTLSFAGWVFTTLGAMLLGLVFAHLARRTQKSGSIYVYTKDAFGGFTGFLSGWSYWCGYWISIPAIATAFVGYLSVFAPGIESSATYEILSALGLIWFLTLLNVFSLKGAGLFQLGTMLLKIIPLLIIIVAGLALGSPENLPPPNPQDKNFFGILAAASIASMWAFSGIEAGAAPAGNIFKPQKTIPRAIVFAVVSVAFIYIAAMYAVMKLVPYEILIESKRPFAEAAKVLGSWGPYLIAFGALIAMAGSLNGIILVTGQMPMAMALDKTAPKFLAKGHEKGTPYWSLVLAAVLASILLWMSKSKGDLLAIFELLYTMSMFMYLLPLFMSCLAEIKNSWRSAKGWVGVAFLAALYSAFTIFGAGLESMVLGLILLAAGLPVYVLMKRRANQSPLEN